MTVLIDIGNTRIKWATLSAGKLVRRGSAVLRHSLVPPSAAAMRARGTLTATGPKLPSNCCSRVW